MIVLFTFQIDPFDSVTAQRQYSNKCFFLTLLCFYRYSNSKIIPVKS